MKITRKSRFTGKENTMEIPVTPSRLDEWARSGDYIQNFFSDLTPDEREFLLTGCTPDEWNAMFGSDDE